MPCFSRKFCIGLIPPVFGWAAFMCCMLFGFWCQSVKFEPATSSAEGNLVEPFYYGPWTKQETQMTQVDVGGETRIFEGQVCRNLSGDIDTDSKLKTVRAFTIITPIVGGLLTVALFLTSCLYFMSAGTWKAVALTFSVILTLFQGLTFLLLQSSACTTNPLLFAQPPSGQTEAEWADFVGAAYKDECAWDKGMSTNVIATVCWFLTGVTMLILGPPKRPERPPPETQEVTYQKTTNPDGTTTVAEVNVVKGTAVPPPAANTDKLEEPSAA